MSMFCIGKKMSFPSRFILLILSSILFACGSAEKKNSQESDLYAAYSADIDNGIYLFNYHCSGCHGTQAQGVLGPNIQGKQPADIRDALGRVSNMSYLPDFTDQELVDIASHLETLKLESEQKSQTANSLGVSKELGKSRVEYWSLPIKLPYQYAVVDVLNDKDEFIAEFYHSPRHPLTEIIYHEMEFPVIFIVHDVVTGDKQTQILYAPMSVDFNQRQEL